MTQTQRHRHGRAWPEHLVGAPSRVFLIAVMLLMSTLAYVAPESGLHQSTTAQMWLSLILYFVLSIAVFLHPTHREWCNAIVAVCFTTFLALDLSGTENFTIIVPILLYVTYLVSAYSRPQLRYWWLAWIVAGSAVGLWTEYSRVASTPELAEFPTHRAFIAGGILTAGTLGFAWLLGVQRRRMEIDQQILRDRAELSAVVERTRIAREMHDIVAHNLSAVIALADGARYASTKNPELAQQALITIADASREALGQMRGLLSVLRDDATRNPNAISIFAIKGLLADAHRSGLNVTTSGFEQIPHDVPQLTQSTLYRIIQEMLTNMLKHSPDKTGSLRVSVGSKNIRITATNRANHSDAAPGFGLLGMGERVRALGGSLQISDEDEFELIVELPR